VVALGSVFGRAVVDVLVEVVEVRRGDESDCEPLHAAASTARTSTAVDGLRRGSFIHQQDARCPSATPPLDGKDLEKTDESRSNRRLRKIIDKSDRGP
jgi:hypothetical protein